MAAGRPGDAGADDDHVGGLVPVDRLGAALRSRRPPAPPRRRRSRALGQKRSPAEILPGHGRASPMVVLLWHHLEPAPGGVKGRLAALECIEREDSALSFSCCWPASAAARAQPVCDAPTEGGRVVASAWRSPTSTTARRIRPGADWMVERTTTASAAVQLFQPGRQLQPEVLFARPRQEDRARHALSRRSPVGATPAHARRSDENTSSSSARARRACPPRWRPPKRRARKTSPSPSP